MFDQVLVDKYFKVSIRLLFAGTSFVICLFKKNSAYDDFFRNYEVMSSEW